MGITEGLHYNREMEENDNNNRPHLALENLTSNEFFKEFRRKDNKRRIYCVILCSPKRGYLQ